MIAPEHELTDLDFNSETWRKLVLRYEERLQKLRAVNDSPTSELQTALMRGRIREIKELLGLSTPMPENQSNDLEY